jgi:hypothetical protein
VRQHFPQTPLPLHVPLMANSAFLSLISPDAGGAAAWAACILTARVRREARHGLAETLLNLRLRAWDVIAKDIVSMLLVLNKIIINIKRASLGYPWGIVCVAGWQSDTD